EERHETILPASRCGGLGACRTRSRRGSGMPFAPAQVACIGFPGEGGESMIRFAGSLLGVVALGVGLAAGAGAQGVGDPPATPPPADVIISPGDVITITVVGEPDL